MLFIDFNRLNMKLLLLVLVALSGLLCQSHSASTPPKIIKQSPNDIFYKVNEMVKIECEASGDPAPSYWWRRADVTYTPEGNDERVVLQKGVGTLIINSPEDKDEGIYQCFATNNFGTAATIKFNLRMAKLRPFATSDPIIHRPPLGTYLLLNCSSPDSVPDGHVTWTVYDQGIYKAVIWDSRVTVDYDDNLHFTYVAATDSMGGKPYHCMVSNKIMRMSVIGPPHYIHPTGTHETFTPMTKAWPASRFDDTALIGSDWKKKCIFSGNPVPSVIWKKKGSDRFNERVELGNSGGQEIIIRNLQYEDAGTYLCDGTREQEASPMEMSFSLKINAAPSWISTPKDVTLIESGDAMFECLADGQPRVKTFWFVNGAPLEEALTNDFRLDSRFQHLTESKIFFRSLTRIDNMVFQCNVTNNLGYLWAEATLNVIPTPNPKPQNETDKTVAPVILKRPSFIKVAEGQSFDMPCHVVGKPDPKITWYRGSMQITGGRYSVDINGNLHVKKSVLSDAGEYRCHASNTYGETEASGAVIVRRKTLIAQKPMDVEVRSGVSAKFTCSGTTDPEEISNLRTIWMKEHEVIQLGTRMFLNKQDSSLTISGTEQRDTGTFTCVITNGLDNETASARLVVTDSPLPPSQVNITESCSADNKANLTWMPGSFNNAPIQYFTIEYSTALDPNRWVFAAQVRQTDNTVFVPLSPGMDYKFRVTSYNKIGPSKPSEPTNKACVTTESVPTQNPRNLRTIGDMVGNLHIQWTPVPPEHQGGPGCFYRLTLMRVGQPDSNKETITIQNWQEFEVIRSGTGPAYQPYQISIVAVNPSGNSIEPAPTIIGYSDEGLPQISPYALEVLSVDSDTVTLQWKFDSREIGKIDSKIRGEFMGFKIQLWLQDYRRETIKDVDLRPADLEGQSTIYNATIKHYMPNGNLEVRIALLNNYFVSAPSESIKFRTPTGLSGPVEYMEEMNIADNHINLMWRPPLDNRGDLEGYDIGYQEVQGLRLGELQDMQPQLDDPYATTAMLSGLLPNTKYRIHIWPRTAAGRGEVFYIERTTAPPGIPNIPRFSIVDVGKDYINVSWWRDPYVSSGSVIFVEYRKEDGADWLRTSADVSKEWAQLRGLQPGMKYVVRIVATTGQIRRLSQEEYVRTDGTAKAYNITDNLGWLLSMLASIVIYISLLVGLLICYNKGFTFKTREKEDHVTTYREGDETYTETEELSTNVNEKRMEPIGHINQFYQDTEHVDSEEDYNDRFRDKDYRENYDDKDFRDSYDDKNYRDSNYDEDYEQSGHESVDGADYRVTSRHRGSPETSDDGYEKYEVGETPEKVHRVEQYTEDREASQSTHPRSSRDILYSRRHHSTGRSTQPRDDDWRHSDDDQVPEVSGQVQSTFV